MTAYALIMTTIYLGFAALAVYAAKDWVFEILALILFAIVDGFNWLRQRYGTR